MERVIVQKTYWLYQLRIDTIFSLAELFYDDRAGNQLLEQILTCTSLSAKTSTISLLLVQAQRV